MSTSGKERAANARRKLEEASHFYGAMRAPVGERAIFEHNLSAFLTAARSAVEQIEKAAATAGSTGRSWFNQEIARSRCIKFFKRLRDANVHEVPVQPKGKSVAFTSNCLILLDEGLELLEVGGKKPVHVPSTEPVMRAHLPVVSTTYTFDRWKGTEDVVTLAREYLRDLQALLAAGCAKGLLQI